MGDGITNVERGLTNQFGSRHITNYNWPSQSDIDETALISSISSAMATSNKSTKDKVKHDIELDPKNPIRNLEHSHWAAKYDRLVYLRSWLEVIHYPDGKIDNDFIFNAMFDYETRRLKNAPPKYEKATQSLVKRLDEERTTRDENREHREEQEFLRQLEEIRAAEQIERQSRAMRFDRRRYPIYTHGGFVTGAGIGAIMEPYVRPFLHVLNLVLDFIPIVGQIKGVAEAIIGYDMTGRKLEDWERGLGGILAIIPGARGVFKAGKEGIKALAWAGVRAAERGHDAMHVFRTAKVASRITEAEIQAARITRMVSGQTSPETLRSVEKVAGLLSEMQGQSKRSWRAVAGVIDNGVVTSQRAAGVIDTAAKVPGKVIVATKATAQIVSGLEKAGITSNAVSSLERVGVNFTKNLVKEISKSKSVVNFINDFHKCQGFAELVKDLTVSAGKRDGAIFVMKFSNKTVKPALAKFELGAGISKRIHSTEVAARRVDITVDNISYELKSWSKSTLERALRRPKQLVNDTAIFGRENIKWVFDAKKGISKGEIVEEFKKAVLNDVYLREKWPKGTELDRALEELIVMF